MQYLAVMAILAAAMLAPRPSLSAGLSDCGLMQSDCRDLIGKRLWIMIPKSNANNVELTPIADDWTNTKRYRTGSFVITGVQKDKYVSHNFSVKMSDGATGFISSSSYIFLQESDPVEAERRRVEAIQSAKEDCARRGQPKIGMTAGELVETCWRQPKRIVKKTTAAGVEENYVYGIGHIVKFTDGKVSEIVEAR
jgi:hypothetical protein